MRVFYSALWDYHLFKDSFKMESKCTFSTARVLLLVIQAFIVMSSPITSSLSKENNDSTMMSSELSQSSLSSSSTIQSGYDESSLSSESSYSVSSERDVRNTGLTLKRLHARKIRILQRLLRQLSPAEVLDIYRGLQQDAKHAREKRLHLRGKDSFSKHRRRGLKRENHVVEIQHGPYIDIDISTPVECPSTTGGERRLFACPTPDRHGVWKCIDDHALCDGKPHCPAGEDEDATVCMFHKMTMNYFKVLMDAVFGLSRSVV